MARAKYLGKADGRVAFRLPSDLIRDLDKYADTVRRSHPGSQYTRSDAVRELLASRLREVR